MNILFVNYGDFTTNSLNHIAGFARQLGVLGHACAVAVPEGKDTLAVIPDPSFIAVTYAEALGKPNLFPGNGPADIVHAWTPREGVRKFVLAYQRKAHARLVTHLEDNEEFLLAAWLKMPVESVRDLAEVEIARDVASTLAHPRRYRQFLRTADGITAIVEPLRQLVPPGMPSILLEPGVDFSRYHPQKPDPAYRREIGLKPEEKVLVFTGSNTFANEPEMLELYEAVALLNEQGFPTRLVRTGHSTPQFEASLPPRILAFVKNLGFIPKDRLPGLLALADVLVQPGKPGAFNDLRLPSKLPEFLSVGRPVVLPASNIGLEVRNGIDAVLLRTGGAAEIAEACRRVFADPAWAESLGKNAVTFARRRFDLSHNARRLADFYDTLRERPKREGSTAVMTEGDTELSLALRDLAARATDAEAAGIAHDLVPLVEALERQDMAQAERIRLERERTDALRNLDVAQKRAAQFEGDLGLSRQHAVNLEGNVATLERNLADQERHLANLQKNIATLEDDIASLERNLAATRERLQEEEQSLRVTHHHAVRLEQLRGSLQRQIRDLDTERARLVEIVGQRNNEIVQRNDAIAQREAKIRALQDSFSWRLTQPLRFLRRKLVDPWRRPAAPAALPSAQGQPVRAEESRPRELQYIPADPVHDAADKPVRPLRFSVDRPERWQLPPGKSVLRGWLFAEDGGKITAIRAVLPDRIIAGTYGLRRPDVAAAVGRIAGSETCGWQITVEVRPGDTQLDLEAADEAGAWQAFVQTTLVVGGSGAPAPIESYEQWVEAYDSPTVADLQAQVRRAGALAYQPLFSVLVPVYNTPERWLQRAIDSVRAQTYPRWELCLADDASTDPLVRPFLEKAAAEDARIKVAFRGQNGHIAATSNSALELATGEFTALLDHDDELAPNALLEMAEALQVAPEADYLYSDEDKIDEDGARHSPYFKPDWLPDLFAGQNYTSHLSVYRTALVRQVGGFRVGFEGSQDWDLTLRVVEQTTPDRIRHIPKILYHWRAIPGSTALLLSEKDYVETAAERALVEHFSRLGQQVEVLPVPGGHWRIRYLLPATPPLVSLIIPTRNGLTVLRRCLDSLLEKTTYPRFEILVVDNGSDDPATLAYLATLRDGSHPLLAPHHTVRVLPYAEPFNFSAINNYAVREAAGEVVGLLNNDLEVITPSWLEEMTAQALRPEIGCVGAMLYYPNDTIQHAGCVLGIGGVAGHAFKTFPRGDEGKFNRARLVQNYSAVTAACLVVRKAIYEQVGGLDERDLAVAFNDIDLCLKVLAAGYRNLWTPFAEFYHHESASRGADDTPEKAGRFRAEVEKMLNRWEDVLQNDPAYNPNLTLEDEHFSLAARPRGPKP